MKKTLCALALLAAAVGCRGQVSSAPPVHIIPDMDYQPRFQDQEANAFFADGRAMRPQIPGTVASGYLKEDDAFYRGKQGDAFLALAPIEVTEATLRRGQERFNIFCAPCHDRSGSGKGMVVQRGFPPPLDLAGDRVRGLPDGEIFHVISNGVRNMPAYGAQITEADRWAIVTWVRVLGRSQHASINDVPAQMQGSIQAPGGTP
ncbi:MAG: cytochrome c [Myxococcota bacterium]